jgi:hypothetical protein
MRELRIVPPGRKRLTRAIDTPCQVSSKASVTSEPIVFTTHEKEPRPEDLRATAEALHEFLHRPDELAPDEPTKTSLPFTVSVRLFRVPRSASRHPDVLGDPG